MAVEDSQAPESLDLFIAPLGDAALRHAGLLARDLRREGIGVELATEGKLKRAMELANKLGARFTLIVGDNEIAAGEYALKNMQTGEQHSVTASNIKNRYAIKRPTRFSRRPQAHAFVRPAPRVRRRFARASDGLGAPPPRPGRSHLHPPARSRRRLAGGLSHRFRSGDARQGGTAALGVRGRGGGTRRSAHAGNDQRQYPDRRSRNRRRQDLDSQRIAHAAVSDGRLDRRQRRRAPEVSLRRSAPAAHAAQHHSALADFVRRARSAVQAGLPRNRDAVHDAVDSGGRARLPGAEPRPAGHLLRAAAIAADFQAAADDQRLRQVFSDRALLPR